MKHLFVPFEIALKLKELGFIEPCIAFYSYETSEIYPVMQEPTKGSHFNTGNFLVTLRAPLFQQVFDWFRDKYNLNSEIRSYTAKKFTFIIQRLEDTVVYYGNYNNSFNLYEEAQIACLEKLIEIIKQNL